MSASLHPIVRLAATPADKEAAIRQAGELLLEGTVTVYLCTLGVIALHALVHRSPCGGWLGALHSVESTCHTRRGKQ